MPIYFFDLIFSQIFFLSKKNQVFLLFKINHLELYSQGDVQFMQPDLKVKNTSSEIFETLKETNGKLNLVDELGSKTYKMKDISDKKRGQFALEVLRAHNKLRDHHGTESLALEKKVNYQRLCKISFTFQTPASVVSSELHYKPHAHGASEAGRNLMQANCASTCNTVWKYLFYYSVIFILHLLARLKIRKE